MGEIVDEKILRQVKGAITTINQDIHELKTRMTILEIGPTLPMEPKPKHEFDGVTEKEILKEVQDKLKAYYQYVFKKSGGRYVDAARIADMDYQRLRRIFWKMNRGQKL